MVKLWNLHRHIRSLMFSHVDLIAVCVIWEQIVSRTNKNISLFTRNHLKC